MRIRARARTVTALLVTGVLVVGAAVSALQSAEAAAASVPRPDHVVIVVEENRSGPQVIGNPAAPYINSLASTGANFTQSFAETHPSQPNYISFFSGSANGVTDDNCPYSFSTPNLGSELISANLGFVGYSEGLPGVGDTTCGAGNYARKHNPWVDFPAVPAASNQPFSAFPTDYSTLPAVSFVVPDLQHDMHDGTIAQGDSWLHDNLDGYVAWAKTHNSVFILTFDEDDDTANNLIPTVFIGGPVVAGSYPETINHYNVLRTIQDAYGLAPIGASVNAAPILDVWTPPAGNQPPRAVFTSSCAQMVCSFDGSGSSDPDGSISSYAWTFGDGSTGTGATSSHTFATGGTDSVVLTVTDNQGATGSVTHSVTVANALAVDAFARTLAGGWGSADVGGGWTTSGTASLFSVDGTVGQMKLTAPGAGLAAALNGVSATNVNVLVDVSVDKVGTGNGSYIVLMARNTATSAYRVKVAFLSGGVLHVAWSRVVGGAETTVREVVVNGVTYSAGDLLRIRLQVSGSGGVTTVSGKVWKVGTNEPATTQISGTDTTAGLQGPGAIAVQSYLSSSATNAPVTVKYDNLNVTTFGANQSPSAGFTSACSQLSCSFDGSGSSDPDGSVSGFGWTFGDGTTGSGAKPAHVFAAAGTYPVVLTVTDNQGATGSVSHGVTVSAAIAVDAFGRTTTGGWGSADVGGMWATSGGTSAFSVAGGVGQAKVPSASSGLTATLTGVSAANVNIVLDCRVDKLGTGDGTYVILMARRSGTSDYRLKLRLLPGGVLHLAWSRVVAGSETTVREVVATNVTYAAGDVLRLRLQVSGAGGTTALSGRVWKVGTSEPAAAQITGTDATVSLQGPGPVAVQSSLASTVSNAPVTVSYDNLMVTAG